jgi:hypothetical protein
MHHPSLTPKISIDDFKNHYFLKKELIDFCSQNNLPTTGSKIELNHRIVHFLETGKIAKIATPSITKKMPKELTRETVITKGFKLGKELRAFFLQELGSSFHFNQIMRDFIQQEIGKTLGDAIKAHEKDQQLPKKTKNIAPQFEYNRHIREFFQSHPDKTLAEAIAVWKVKKAR